MSLDYCARKHAIAAGLGYLYDDPPRIGESALINALSDPKRALEMYDSDHGNIPTTPTESAQP